MFICLKCHTKQKTCDAKTRLAYGCVMPVPGCSPEVWCEDNTRLRCFMLPLTRLSDIDQDHSQHTLLSSGVLLQVLALS